jgi:hypothetical protein
VPLFALNLALFESYLNHFAAARKDLARALALFPDYSQGSALAAQFPEMERERRELELMSPDAPALDRARLLGKLGLAAEAMVAWRAALSQPDVTRAEFEEGLSFAIREGTAESAAQFHREYRARFPTPDPKLELVYETRAELVRRLRDAWPTLGISSAVGPRQ